MKSYIDDSDPTFGAKPNTERLCEPTPKPIAVFRLFRHEFHSLLVVITAIDISKSPIVMSDEDIRHKHMICGQFSEHKRDFVVIVSEGLTER